MHPLPHLLSSPLKDLNSPITIIYNPLHLYSISLTYLQNFHNYNSLTIANPLSTNYCISIILTSTSSHNSIIISTSPKIKNISPKNRISHIPQKYPKSHVLDLIKSPSILDLSLDESKFITKPKNPIISKKTCILPHFSIQLLSLIKHQKYYKPDPTIYLKSSTF